MSAGAEALDAVRARFADSDLVEVSAPFVIPDAPRRERIGGATVDVRLRFPVRATLGDGATVFLRSHGLDFNIVPPEWLRAGLDACYSVGPGLLDGREVALVLAQDFRPDSSALERLVGADRAGAAVLIERGTEYGRPCTRASVAIAGS